MIRILGKGNIVRDGKSGDYHPRFHPRPPNYAPWSRRLPRPRPCCPQHRPLKISRGITASATENIPRIQLSRRAATRAGTPLSWRHENYVIHILTARNGSNAGSSTAGMSVDLNDWLQRNHNVEVKMKSAVRSFTYHIHETNGRVQIQINTELMMKRCLFYTQRNTHSNQSWRASQMEWFHWSDWIQTLSL